jgi:DNA repair ATPase RecN
MQLARETSKAINAYIINHEAHEMRMAELGTRLSESEHVRHLLYEEMRRLAGETRRLDVNLMLLQTRYDVLQTRYDDMVYSVRNKGGEEYYAMEKLKETVQELEKQKEVDALLHGSALYRINMLHKKISKLEHQVSGFKGVVTKKNKVIAELRRQVSGV